MERHECEPVELSDTDTQSQQVQNPVVADDPYCGLKLGDTVSVCEFRRDFVQGIDDSGAEGWVENGSGRIQLSETEEHGAKVLPTKPNGKITQIQQGTDGEYRNFPWKLHYGKRFVFMTRIKLSHLDSLVYIGLSSATTNITNSRHQGLFFRKNQVNTELEFVSVKDGHENIIDNVGIIPADEYIELGFHWCDDKIKTFYRAAPGEWTTKVLPFTDSHIKSEMALAITVAIRSLIDLERKLYIDYIHVVSER